MPYSITNRCIQCDSCLPLCPTGAITLVEGQDFWIDPSLCNDCKGYYPDPQCVRACPVDSPVPFQAKKGRCRTAEAKIITNPELFPNTKSSPFASSIVVWELCNILAQQQSFPWQTDAGTLYYHRQINQGRGSLTFRVADTLSSELSVPLATQAALEVIQRFDVRAACLHLIYAAYAASLESPWQQEFLISDRQIEEYLGLDKRRDLSKPAKLALIKELAQQPCKLLVSLDWKPQGKVSGFVLQQSRLWHLLEIRHHFQQDELGCKHLMGLTFRVKAGEWTKYFLNRQACRDSTGFYQYGTLPKSLLTLVMSIWQQHEGAARILLWLLFKTKMGKEQRIMVRTLMRVAYGEDKVAQAATHREHRKRLLKTFEGDLEILNHYGIKPVFDPVTYPPAIQPLWAKLVDLPDDAEEALEFWINDANREARLTDSAPRGKWNRLMNARLLCFDLPEDWQKQTFRQDEKKRTRKNHRKSSKVQSTLSSQQITEARKQLQLSQRALADRIGKSQSWVRDVESGRLQPNLKDQSLLRKVLCIG